MCFEWYCSLDTLCDTIESIWKEWEDLDFVENLSERFRNFIFHFLESPLVTNDSEKEIERRKKLRDNICKKWESIRPFLFSAVIPFRLPVRQKPTMQTFDIIVERLEILIIY